MRKIIIWFICLFLLFIIGNSAFMVWKSQLVHWVANDSQPVQYYVMSTSKALTVGKFLDAIITVGASNGPLSHWSTNMSSKKTIMIYEIPGINTSEEVAVRINSEDLKANSAGSRKP